MKKILIVALTIMMMMSISLAQEIDITLNGEKLNTDVAPIEIEGRVMVPVRVISEKLGASVDFNFETNEITITQNNNIIKLTLESKNVYINGSLKVLDVPAKEINNRTLVPVRFVSESLGLNVIWDDKTYTAHIMTNEYLAELERQAQIMTDKIIQNINQSKVMEDKTTSYKIGEGIRMWLKESTNTEVNQLTNQFKKLSELSNFDIYLKNNSRGFASIITAGLSINMKPVSLPTGDFYVIIQNEKIKIAIASSIKEANSLIGTAKVYDGIAGWTYLEGSKNLSEDLKSEL